jgi:uncharacterized protein (TIGR03086 family)
MLINDDIVALDADALRTSTGLVAQATVADLARPTPCDGWTLGDLLDHMTAQHYGFAAASAGDGDRAHWRVRKLGDDAVPAYLTASEHVLAAFAAEGVLNGEFPLPEFPGSPAVPARQAISFHFVDYVVHSWDVAKTLGLPVSFDPALLQMALTVARAVPGGEARLRSGAAFGPEVACTGESPLDQIVAALGRTPGWPQL